MSASNIPVGLPEPFRQTPASSTTRKAVTELVSNVVSFYSTAVPPVLTGSVTLKPGQVGPMVINSSVTGLVFPSAADLFTVFSPARAGDVYTFPIYVKDSAAGPISAGSGAVFTPADPVFSGPQVLNAFIEFVDIVTPACNISIVNASD